MRTPDSGLIELHTRGRYRNPYKLVEAFKFGRIKLRMVGVNRLVGKDYFTKGTPIRITYRHGTVITCL